MNGVRDLISQVLEKMGIRADVEERAISELSIPYFNIVTDEARLLIGARAQNLLALEYILKRFLERDASADAGKFFLDVNGYRLHYIESLKDEAKGIAKKVRLYRTELVLKPMPPFERRIIHMTLAVYPDITTESVGEGEARRVVIKPYP